MSVQRQFAQKLDRQVGSHTRDDFHAGVPPKDDGVIPAEPLRAQNYQGWQLDSLSAYKDCPGFRLSINGLSVLVEQALGLDPFASCAYVFSNRRRDRVKILGWERNGFWLLLKRLEKDRTGSSGPQPMRFPR